MKKMPCLFVRRFTQDPRRPHKTIAAEIGDQVTPGCEWVIAGEGRATRKWDGTACLIRNGRLFRRYDAKHGKPAPAGFEPCQEPDPVTGHWPGWVPVGEEPESHWHLVAKSRSQDGGEWPPPDGTYELVGPRVGGNERSIPEHLFIQHGAVWAHDCPRDFAGLREYLRAYDGEGVVFHHPDGRMAKIRRDDFGFDWPRAAPFEEK